jgi:RNA polymerase sigma-70 factor (ECF subfamily)
MLNERPEWSCQIRARLVAGDESALSEVYDAYAALAFGIATRILRDPTSAEDVVQDVFVSLWERPEAYDPDRGPLRAWLSLLTRRRAIDAVRRDVARGRREVAYAQDDLVLPGVDDGVVQDTLAKAVRAALAKLPEPQRVAIVLAYYEGLTYLQVAGRLQVPEGTAKSRLRSGLRTLAAQLETVDLI